MPRAPRNIMAKRLGLLAPVLLLLSMAIGATQRAPADVVIVLSGDAAPYRAAAAAAADRLQRSGRSSRTMLVSEIASEGRTALNGASAIMTVGTQAATGMEAAAPEHLALVYCMVSDPEAAGLTRSPRARGISVTVPVRAQLAVIGRALPRARHIGMLYRRSDAGHRRLVDTMRGALPADARLSAIAVDDFDSIAAAVDVLYTSDVDVVWTFPDSTLYAAGTVRKLLLTGVRNRTPVFGYSPQFVRAGALVGVGVDPATQGRQAASLTVEYLTELGRAASLSSRPPVAPSHQIAVNLITADLLSIDLPASIVGEAEHVFRK